MNEKKIARKLAEELVLFANFRASMEQSDVEEAARLLRELDELCTAARGYLDARANNQNRGAGESVAELQSLAVLAHVVERIEHG